VALVLCVCLCALAFQVYEPAEAQAALPVAAALVGGAALVVLAAVVSSYRTSPNLAAACDDIGVSIREGALYQAAYTRFVYDHAALFANTEIKGAIGTFQGMKAVAAYVEARGAAYQARWVAALNASTISGSTAYVPMLTNETWGAMGVTGATGGRVGQYVLHNWPDAVYNVDALGWDYHDNATTVWATTAPAINSNSVFVESVGAATWRTGAASDLFPRYGSSILPPYMPSTGYCADSSVKAQMSAWVAAAVRGEPSPFIFMGGPTGDAISMSGNVITLNGNLIPRWYTGSSLAGAAVGNTQPVVQQITWTWDVSTQARTGSMTAAQADALLDEIDGPAWAGAWQNSAYSSWSTFAAAINTSGAEGLVKANPLAYTNTAPAGLTVDADLLSKNGTTARTAAEGVTGSTVSPIPVDWEGTVPDSSGWAGWGAGIGSWLGTAADAITANLAGFETWTASQTGIGQGFAQVLQVIAFPAILGLKGLALIMGWLGDLIPALGALLSEVWADISLWILTQWLATTATLTGAMTASWDWLKSVWADLVAAIGGITGAVAASFTTVPAWAQTAWETITAPVLSAVADLSDLLWPFDAAKDAGGGAL